MGGGTGGFTISDSDADRMGLPRGTYIPYGSEGPGGFTGHAQDPGFGQIGWGGGLNHRSPMQVGGDPSQAVPGQNYIMSNGGIPGQGQFGGEWTPTNQRPIPPWMQGANGTLGSLGQRETGPPPGMSQESWQQGEDYLNGLTKPHTNIFGQQVPGMPRPSGGFSLSSLGNAIGSSGGNVTSKQPSGWRGGVVDYVKGLKGY
jgi:hypothetical protein